MRNSDIRDLAKQHSVKFWEIAELLNVSEATITRWLRKDLTENKKAKFIAAIEAISERKGDRI